MLATLPDVFGTLKGRIDLRPATGSGPGLKTPSDPVNLVFVGDADPLRIRTALLSLTPDRDPNWEIVAGRFARWRDAIGHLHATHAGDHGWCASAVQLELGRYKGSRAHLRLFAYESFTLGAAHVEFLPKGDYRHQVVSWELGEELVAQELIRAGVLAEPPVRVGPIETGLERTIPAALVLAAPTGLASLARLPRGTLAPAPIRGNGYVSALMLKPLPPAEGERSWSSVSLDLATDVTDPCLGADDERFRVTGPVCLEQELVTSADTLTVRLAVRGSVAVGERRFGHVVEGQVASLRRRRTRAALLGDYRVTNGAGEDASWWRRIRSRLVSGREPVLSIGRSE